MTKTEVLASIEELEGEIHRVEIKGLEGEHLVMAGEEETIPPGRAGGEPVVNLLPALDHYVMGYKDRRRFLDPEHHDQVFDRSGNAFPTVLLNGRIVGVWYEAGRKTKILLWEEVSGEVRRTISGEAVALAGFLGRKTTPTIEAYPSDLRVETPYRLGRR